MTSSWRTSWRWRWSAAPPEAGAAVPSQGDGRLCRALEATLPFQLTESQQTAAAEIAEDLAKERRMLRLLQGDVGSGKTVVALLAMLVAVEAGAQAALMVPTELLANQHAETLGTLLADSGVSLALLTGREKGRAREQTLAALAAGEVDILVGTHALFQKGVDFKDLALAVVDEQHRFGVHQRMLLARKGPAADLLVMTATPIPRSLVLTAYGDMDVSRIEGRLPGRAAVATRAMPLDRLEEVVAAVHRALATGAKVYWVCPLVEESEVVDLAAATDRHASLAEAFGARVALIHGQMKGPEKDAAMAAFAGDGADILVATTVVEVGVDVAAATIMIVEHAERFGLAQLHQLRGRVGRGQEPGTCLLLYAAPLGETATGADQHPARDRRRLPHRRGRPAPQGRGRAAGHAPERHAGLPPRRPCRPRRAAGGRPRRRAPRARARSRAGIGARPGAAHPALSLRARHGGALPALGLSRVSREGRGGVRGARDSPTTPRSARGTS